MEAHHQLFDPERSRGILYFRQLLRLAACLALFAVPALAKSWRISDYQDTIVIVKDGSAVVHERINLVFVGEWHGIHRTIPVDYPGPSGTNYTLYFNVLGITDGNGHKLKYESKTSKGFRDLKIYIPNAVDTTTTVDIEYMVRNGVRYFADHDEFYWNVTGNDWPVPIDHVTARVSFPADAKGLCAPRPSPVSTVLPNVMPLPTSRDPMLNLRPPIPCPCAAG